MANHPESRNSENRGNMNAQWGENQSAGGSSSHMTSGQSKDKGRRDKSQSISGRETQSAGSSGTQMNSSLHGKNTIRSDRSQSVSGRPDSLRSSGDTGSQHTNAGNTGFSSGQISPKTQNATRGRGSSTSRSRKSS